MLTIYICIFFRNKFFKNLRGLVMRTKKSNIVYYVIAAVAILAIGAAIFMEVPLSQERIEQTLK